MFQSYKSKSIYKTVILSEKPSYADILKERRIYHIPAFKDTIYLSKKNPRKHDNCEHILPTRNIPVIDNEKIEEFFSNLKAIFHAAAYAGYLIEAYMINIKIISAAFKINGLSVAKFTLTQILLTNKDYFTTAARCILWGG